MSCLVLDVRSWRQRHKQPSVAVEMSCVRTVARQGRSTRAFAVLFGWTRAILCDNLGERSSSKVAMVHAVPIHESTTLMVDETGNHDQGVPLAKGTGSE